MESMTVDTEIKDSKIFDLSKNAFFPKESESKIDFFKLNSSLEGFKMYNLPIEILSQVI